MLWGRSFVVLCDRMCLCYSSCGTWWHTRRNQISSFSETDESIQIGGGVSSVDCLAAEVCASALVMLDIRRSEVAWEYWLPTPFASFPPLTSPSVRYRVPPGSERALQPSFQIRNRTNSDNKTDLQDIFADLYAAYSSNTSRQDCKIHARFLTVFQLYLILFYMTDLTEKHILYQTAKLIYQFQN